MSTPPTISVSGRLRTAFLVLLIVVVGLWVVLSHATRSGTPQHMVRVSTSTGADRSQTTTGPSISVPDDFPSDLPLYPDAHVSTVNQRTRSSPYTVELVVQDDLTTVRNHYERLLRQSAWALQSVNSGTGVHITLRKGIRSATVLLETLTAGSDTTRILVTVQPSSGGA